MLDRIGNASHRLGLREPWLRVVKASTRTGFRVAREIGKLATPMRLPRTAAPSGFDLTPTDDQLMLRDVVRKFATDVLRPVASAADAAATPDPQVLARGHELALASLSVSDRFGGIADARSPMTSCLVAEELARGDLGLALALLAPIAVVNALADGGTPWQQERWLPRFTGETFVPAALALLEPQAGFDPMQPQTGAIRCDGGWTLHGTKALVPLAREAELLLVAANVLGRGPQLFVVERGSPGLTITADPAMGARAAGTSRVVLDGVRVGEDAIVAVDHAAIVDSARVMWSALAVGVAQAVLDYVVPYCNERVAFGEPITNRQSVAFAIANIAIEVDAMRLSTWRAAALSDRGATFAREAALARRFCATHGMRIGSDGVQLLGGHGFVKEHPVERWYRDLRAIAVMEGALLA
jgi:alkylation response protein AidB-like acyl-CoA dehydrogenase